MKHILYATMDERKFKFKGPDYDYAKFLESWILAIQELHGPGCTTPCKPGPSPAAHESTGEGSQVVSGTPLPGQGTRLRWPKETVPKWQKQLHKFVDEMPRESRWEDARLHAGLDTSMNNQKAMKMILGHGSTALFHPGWHAAALSAISPVGNNVGNNELVVRGCAYGNFIARCADDQNFAGRVVAFQNLVFCSYCVVMMRRGVSEKMTNDTMREFTGQERDDSTLAKYRHGALWVNRCIAALLARGWGHKSWELFLLSPSIRPLLEHSLTMRQIVEARHSLVGSPPTIPTVTRRWQTSWAIRLFRSGRMPGSHIASPVLSITSQAIPFRKIPVSADGLWLADGLFTG